MASSTDCQPSPADQKDRVQSVLAVGQCCLHTPGRSLETIQNRQLMTQLEGEKAYARTDEQNQWRTNNQASLSSLSPSLFLLSAVLRSRDLPAEAETPLAVRGSSSWGSLFLSLDIYD
jgi:hypothetical protein